MGGYMDEATFQAIKTKLDKDLDALPSDAQVGVKMGWGLYTEFRSRDLLMPKEANMVLWKWNLPSYRDKFIADTFDIADDDYQVGKP